MIRVAFDIAQTAAERAGCAWYADGLGRALARRTDVDLHAYAQFGGWINQQPAAASSIEGATMMLNNVPAEQARAFWTSAETTGLPGQPVIVHSNSYQAPLVRGAHLVFTIHDLSFWTHLRFAPEATRQVCQVGVLDALERASGFVFVSNAARAEFERILPGWFERSERPHAVIHGASRFAPEASIPKRSADAPWLLVGSIEPRKNHVTTLDAYDIYRRNVRAPRPLHLIGGHGWHSSDIHKRIQSLESTHSVRYLGYVRDDELASCYRSAFALIQPSWHEGFGLPVVEALGFGTPVICSDIPSLREIANDAGIFFAPASVHELAEAMIALHNESDRHERLSDLAAKGAARFSWDKSAADVVEFYRLIMQRPLVR